MSQAWVFTQDHCSAVLLVYYNHWRVNCPLSTHVQLPGVGQLSARVPCKASSWVTPAAPSCASVCNFACARMEHSNTRPSVHACML